MGKETRKMLGVDLGASSGRGILGCFDGEKLTLSELHRFANEPLTRDGHLVWDIDSLRENVAEATRRGTAAGAETVGIDTWGVDYALLDGDGGLVAPPVHYRDSRNDTARGCFERYMSAERLYGITGIQSLNFNTVYQLAAERRDTPERLAAARRLLFMPDLFGYYLTGIQACEYTVASTGALLDAKTRSLSPEILSALGIDASLFAPAAQPGDILGRLLPCYGNARVVNVASHDTGSAVIAVPSTGENVLYISSGTWSLMGTELSAPIITPEGRRRNYTNEGGAFGTVRFLKNIMGLWLLQESRRAWRRAGLDISFDELSAAAEAAKPFVSLINPDDPSFTPPGDMPGRIAAYCARTGQRVPQTPGETVRVIFDSLALCYRYTASNIAELTGIRPDAINIVGGGSKDILLDRLCADVCGMPVIAGPAEATAIGNIAIQAIACGAVADISQARELIRRSFDTRVFEPARGRGIYDDAYGRFLKLLASPSDPEADDD